MAIQLIVNADDFGFSPAVNAAVARAHREGVLTSASLMVGESATREAVEVARSLPGLAVGLHLVCDVGGDPIRVALWCCISARARELALMQIEEQFERFASTGLSLSHVDGHRHLHALGVLMPGVVELALRYGARGVRIPNDPVWANIRKDRSRPGYAVVNALGQSYFSRVARKHLSGTSLATCDMSIGAFASGRMREDYVLGMLRGIRVGVVEVYFHPSEANQPLPNPPLKRERAGEPLAEGVQPVPNPPLPSTGSGWREGAGGRTDPLGPNPDDLRTLLSPSLRQFILQNDFTLTTYSGIRGLSAEAVREHA